MPLPEADPGPRQWTVPAHCLLHCTGELGEQLSQRVFGASFPASGQLPSSLKWKSASGIFLLFSFFLLSFLFK